MIPPAEGTIPTPAEVLEIEEKERSELDSKIMGAFAQQFRGAGRYAINPPFHAVQVFTVLTRHWHAVERSGWNGLEFDVEQYGPLVMIDVYRPTERKAAEADEPRDEPSPRWWQFWRQP